MAAVLEELEAVLALLGASLGERLDDDGELVLDEELDLDLPRDLAFLVLLRLPLETPRRRFCCLVSGGMFSFSREVTELSSETSSSEKEYNEENRGKRRGKRNICKMQRFAEL